MSFLLRPVAVGGRIGTRCEHAASRAAATALAVLPMAAAGVGTGGIAIMLIWFSSVTTLGICHIFIALALLLFRHPRRRAAAADGWQRAPGG